VAVTLQSVSLQNPVPELK